MGKETSRRPGAFGKLAADARAASAIIDERLMATVMDMHRRFCVEIGGRWVLVCAPRLTEKGVRKLVAQTVAFMGAFPRVAQSLYPQGAD